MFTEEKCPEIEIQFFSTKKYLTLNSRSKYIFVIWI